MDVSNMRLGEEQRTDMDREECNIINDSSSLELSSDFETRILDAPPFTLRGTLLWIVTHSRGLSTLAT